jgi:hypothetical protein
MREGRSDAVARVSFGPRSHQFVIAAYSLVFRRCFTWVLLGCCSFRRVAGAIATGHLADLAREQIVFEAQVPDRLALRPG